MKNVLKKATAAVLTLCLGMSICICPSLAADEAIAEKTLKYFDETSWTDWSHVAGTTQIFKLPDGIDSMSGGNNDSLNNETQVSGVFGKASEDLSVKLAAKAIKSNNRNVYLHLVKSSDTSTNAANISVGEKYTIYIDMAATSLGNAAFHGLRIRGRQATGSNTAAEHYPVIFKTVDGNPVIQVYNDDEANGNVKNISYTLSTWVSVALETEVVEEGKIKFKTYVNGELAATSVNRNLAGITYVEAGLQWNSSTHTQYPDLYIDNMEFVKSGFSADRYNAIEAASAITVDQIKGSNTSLDSLTGNLTLPTTGSNSTTISWESSHPQLVSTNGTMTPSGTEATDVTLTATVTSGEVSEKKTYTVTVPYDENGYVYTEPVESKSFDFFDTTAWVMDEENTAGTTQSLDYPQSMSLYWNNLQVSKADKVTAALGKDAADASLHIYTDGSVSGNREFGANLFAATDAINAPKNIVAGDKFTTYADLAADEIPEGLGYFGMRIVGRKDSATQTNQFREIFNITNNGDGSYSIVAGEGEREYILNTWVHIAVEAEFKTESTVALKTYINGVLLGTVETTLAGLSYIRAGFQKGTAVTGDASMYIDNVAFRAHEGYSADWSSVISDIGALNEAAIKGSNSSLAAVATDLYLPTEGAKGSSIEWTSSNRSVVSTDGEVTPSYLREITVMLTAAVTSNDVTLSKSFTVNVPVAQIGGDEEEDSSVFKDDFRNYTYKFEDDLSSPLQPFTVAHSEGVYLIYNNKLYSDRSGLGSSTATDKPYVIYKTDEVIAGFEVDTLFYNQSGNYSGDFSFQVSSDGERWIDASDYVTISDKEAAYDDATGYARCTYSGALEDYSNYYLKISWGSAGDVKKRYRSGIDTVTVFYPNEVQLASRDFTFDRISAQEQDNVTENLNLVTTGDYGTTVSWQSDNEAIVSNTGVVNASSFDGYSAEVTLTATFSKDGLESMEKSFEIVVTKDVSAWSDMDFVEYDLNNLTFESFCDQPQSQLVGKVKLPEGVEGGSSFTWSVSNTTAAVLNNTDYVVEFIPDDYKVVDMVLTVTATKGSAQKSKSFNVSLIRGYGKNLILASGISASSGSSTIRKTQDRALVDYWQSDAGDNAKKITVRFTQDTAIGACLLVEKGDNVTGYTIKTSSDNYVWKTVYTGTTLGDKVRLPISFTSETCRYVEISFTSENPVSLYSVELYSSLDMPTDQAKKSIDAIILPTITSTNLTLPTEGAYGGTITWSSANENVITSAGVVSRLSNRDQTTTLTATLTLGSVVVKKDFTVTVAGNIDTGEGGGSGGGGGGGGSSSGSGVVMPFVGSEANTVEGDSTVGSIFKDVAASHWAYSYIYTLKDAGIISAAEYFRPEDKITREEVVKMLVLTIGKEIVKGNNSFSDVDENAWYYPYVSTAAQSGIVQGMGNGIFGIGQNVTRQDLAVMAYRVLEGMGISADTAAEASYTDFSEVAAYAKDAVNAMTYFEIINGFEDGSFAPKANTTRAQCAKIMCVLMNLLSEEAN